MIACLINLIIVAIVLLIVALVIEAIISKFIPQISEVAWLIRLLFGLVLLLYALNCLMGLGYGFHWGVR